MSYEQYPQGGQQPQAEQGQYPQYPQGGAPQYGQPGYGYPVPQQQPGNGLAGMRERVAALPPLNGAGNNTAPITLILFASGGFAADAVCSATMPPAPCSSSQFPLRERWSGTSPRAV